MKKELAPFAPIFEAPRWTAREQELLKPFFTNLTESVYGITIGNEELVGAICSRASRAKGDLREVFLREFLLPTLEPVRAEDESDEDLNERQESARLLEELVTMLQEASVTERMANRKARAFYDKWLAQFGDDSIAQMSGTHVGYWGLSQVALKHLEDQRIGLAPIEKSTRYVDYSAKVEGSYMYYVDATMGDAQFEDVYRAAMDNLFDTYADLVPKVQEWLSERYPQEKKGTVRAKAFDLLRGLLPMSTLSQVAFFANGQAAEYLITRARAHSLGEIQWAGERAYEEWQQVIPSFIRRIDSEGGLEYQEYLRNRRAHLGERSKARFGGAPINETVSGITMLDYRPDGEARVIAGLLYSAEGCEQDFASVLDDVKRMSESEQRDVLEAHFEGRTKRYQKLHRAFEFAEMTFEVVTNNGAYRDLHRHRMLSQQRQLFTVIHGYDVPDELVGTVFEKPFREAIDKATDAYLAVRAAAGPLIAQYASTLAHRVRFIQQQNLRSAFWTVELRTIPEGHPDYRMIEQQKYQAIREVYPLIVEYIMVNLDTYTFARRGQGAKIAQKEQALKKVGGAT